MSEPQAPYETEESVENAMQMLGKGYAFSGFEKPSQNYSKMPHSFIDLLPEIDSMAELKVTLYTLRHTWGFSEYGKPKRITTDEFMNGRKRKNGTRIDRGTGLSNKSVITGLEKAVSRGTLIAFVDDSDKARIEKQYCLNISGVNSGVKDLHTGKEKLHSGYVKITQRSEKETKERNLKHEEEGKNVFTIYTEEIGLLTPFIADALEDWEKLVPAKWITDAFEIAAKNNARSWSYIEAILKRWKAQGNQNDNKKPSQQRNNPVVPQGVNAAMAWLEKTSG